MTDQTKSTHTIGLELQDLLLIAVQLGTKKGSPCLEKIYQIPLVEKKIPLADRESLSANVNPLYIQEEGQIIRKQLESHLVVTTLSCEDVLVRALKVKLKKDRDIDAVLAFQAEPLLPYPVESAILDKMKITQNQEGTHLTLMSVRKEELKRHLELWNGVQIEPEVVTSEVSALTSYSSIFSDIKTAHFVIHIGQMSSSCVLVREGKTLGAQSCHTGLSDLKKAYGLDLGEDGELTEEKFNNLDFASLSELGDPHLWEALLNLRNEITRALYALAKQNKSKDLAEIMVIGPGALLTHLAEVLFRELKMPLIEPKLNDNFSLSMDQLKLFAISIGSALSALPNQFETINFRRDEFAYPHPWKRLRKPMMIYLALSVCLAFAFYFFGEVYLGNQEDEMRKEYVSLLSGMNKSYRTFESEYTSKYPGASGRSPEFSVKMLTQEDLQERMRVLDKELKDNPETFPLMPNIPRVSDVLAWLNTHPQMVGKEGSNQSQSGIQIENFSYSMIKRPELKKKQEKYQIKVEVEFSSPTPKLAREFHDALIAPNEMVDPKGEVKWSSSRGKYRASFFLKDRTIYPIQTQPASS